MDDTSVIATSLPAPRDTATGRPRNANGAASALKGLRTSANATSTSEDASVSPSGPPDSLEKASTVGARLSYDLEDSAVVIEILDKRTGEVIQRLPPETAAERFRKMTGRASGAVLDKTA